MSKETEVMGMIKKAIEGDDAAAEKLGVDSDMLVEFSQASTNTFDKLCVDYKEAVTTLTAARALDIIYVNRIAKQYALLLKFTAREYYKKEFPKTAKVAEQEDVLEMMSMMCTDLPNEKLWKAESDEEEVPSTSNASRKGETKRKGNESYTVQPYPGKEVSAAPSTSRCESEVDSVPSVTTKVNTLLTNVESSRGQKWSEDDTMTLSLPFINVKQVPTKQRIMDIMNSDDELSRILEREGEARVYDKVKNIFESRSKR